MKKFILTAIILLTFGLTGCGESESNNHNEIRSEQASSKSQFITSDISDFDIIVDSIGNVIYENSTSRNSVIIPFSQLTPVQIKMLQERGIEFDQRLLDEKNQQ